MMQEFMKQSMKNDIGNALKMAKMKKPEVVVEAEKKNEEPDTAAVAGEGEEKAEDGTDNQSPEKIEEEKQEGETEVKDDQEVADV